MTELRKIPDHMLPSRPPGDDGLIPALIILIVACGVLYGLYSFAKLAFVRQAPEQAQQVISNNTENHDQLDDSPPSTDSYAESVRKPQAPEELTEDATREEREAYFDERVQLWAGRILSALGASIASVLVPVWTFVILSDSFHFDPIDRLQLSDGQGCLLLVIGFLIAVSWPWLYLIFFVAR